ncbi:hypothetical protein [Glaciecola sp. SC05]|uniref:hypothetical protein n=1 Tax=Glaciecola sp. SC05 TaxID=1987355 RepID=UPI003526F598
MNKRNFLKYSAAGITVAVCGGLITWAIKNLFCRGQLPHAYGKIDNSIDNIKEAFASLFTSKKCYRP